MTSASSMRCGESRYCTNSIRHLCFSLGDPRCARDWAGDQQLGSCAWFCDFAGPGPSATLDKRRCTAKTTEKRMAMNSRSTLASSLYNWSASTSSTPSAAPRGARILPDPLSFGPRTNSSTATPLGERWIENTAGELHSEAVSCMLPAGAELQNGNPG